MPEKHRDLAMTLLTETISHIADPDRQAADAMQRALDAKTKPRGSLGRLEILACQMAAIRGTSDLPPPRKALVVMAADHGVVAEGVSAYPPQVTGQMIRNFARGTAAINVLARQAGATLTVVDVGVAYPPEDLAREAPVLVRRIAAGTRNFTREAAMTAPEVDRALETGIEVAAREAARGTTLLGIGEMGIGNTTAATAIACALSGQPLPALLGRGTGLDDAGLARKQHAIERALQRHAPEPSDPHDVLQKIGGLEIAALVGVVLGAAARRVAVVVDGFIASVAAWLAVRAAPLAQGYLIASHRSAEPGHAAVLEALDLRPLLELELRLGEGTGAALAMPLIDAALCVQREMATFEGAGVTDTGR